MWHCLGPYTQMPKCSSQSANEHLIMLGVAAWTRPATATHRPTCTCDSTKTIRKKISAFITLLINALTLQIAQTLQQDM